jgi:hypothetical protein
MPEASNGYRIEKISREKQRFRRNRTFMFHDQKIFGILSKAPEIENW